MQGIHENHFKGGFSNFKASQIKAVDRNKAKIQSHKNALIEKLGGHIKDQQDS